MTGAGTGTGAPTKERTAETALRDASGPTTEARTYRNPIRESVFADPTAVRTADGTFYAYATYHPWPGTDRPLVPILRSSNLVEWTSVGAAFEEMPDWNDRARGVWAPDVARLDGRYLLYYSLAKFGDPNPGVGVAVADGPTGPFTDRGPLLRSDGVGVPNSIDPCLFVDDDPYLFWGSKRGIYGVRLAADGLSLEEDPFQVAGEGVEAAYVVEREGWYHLFGSRGTCCEGADSSYHVVVGRARSVRGPYRNRADESLVDAAGTTILHGNRTFAGPGHNAVVRDDAGTDWLLYHAYERSNPWAGRMPRRVPMLDPVRWDEGWPTVEGATPGSRNRAPVVRGR